MPLPGSYATRLGKPSELRVHLFHVNLSPLGFSPIINVSLKMYKEIKVSTFGENGPTQQNIQTGGTQRLSWPMERQFLKNINYTCQNFLITKTKELSKLVRLKAKTP